MKETNSDNSDPSQAADALHAAAKGMGTDEKEFIEVLCSCKTETY